MKRIRVFFICMVLVLSTVFILNNLPTVSADPPPVADAGGPYTGKKGIPIHFTGSACGGTEPYSFSWDFDDTDGIQEESTIQNPIYTYVNPGVYNVTLMVTDDNGKIDDDKTISIIGQSMIELETEGAISFIGVKTKSSVNWNFTVRNKGGQRTELDWEISSYPEWGTWTFTPDSGYSLTPEAGPINVNVAIVAPTVKKKSDFTGVVKVINLDNSSDYEELPVSMTVLKTKMFTFMDFYRLLFYLFSLFEKILNQ